jgi:hypothetical protein
MFSVPKNLENSAKKLADQDKNHGRKKNADPLTLAVFSTHSHFPTASEICMPCTVKISLKSSNTQRLQHGHLQVKYNSNVTTVQRYGADHVLRRSTIIHQGWLHQ